MPTTDDHPANGERFHDTCTIQAHDRVRTAGDLVHRLVVTDERGWRYVVLVSGDHDPAFAVGETYRFEHLVWSGPVPETGDETECQECPECGAPGRRPAGADAVDRAVSRMANGFDPHEFDGTPPVEGLAVVDGDTNVDGLAIDGPDDERPIPGPALPAYVCTDCGCGIADDIRADVDENRGPRRIVDHVDPIHDDGTS